MCQMMTLALPKLDQEPMGCTMQGPATSLLGVTREEMVRLVLELGEPAFRGQQLFAAIFREQRSSFAEMSNIPRRLRDNLALRFSLARPDIATLQVSADGTRKYAFGDGDHAFEAVYIPEVAKERTTNTLCLSSQTGCSLGCRFCFTASIRQPRNLTAAEIVGQLLAVLDDVAALGDLSKVTNVVFMGMGEPLLNYAEVVKAARILIDDAGLDFSSRRVTVSTAGIVPRIRDLGRDLPVQLAISLNATTDAVRDEIMPINRKWPLGDLLQALRDFPLKSRRRFTVEYVLLKGINDSLEDAKRLPKLLAGIPVKVNLLPLNAHDRTDLLPPDESRVLHFQEHLKRAGITAHIRTPRGRDIAAACGQLGHALTSGHSDASK